MKKNTPFIICIAAGLLLIPIGLYLKEDYYSTWIIAFGSALIFANMIHLLRDFYWNAPKRKAEYEFRQREEKIKAKDEREIYLRKSAGDITHQITTLILLVICVVLSLIRAEPWIILIFYLLFLFQCFCRILLIRIFRKQM